MKVRKSAATQRLPAPASEQFALHQVRPVEHTPDCAENTGLTWLLEVMC
jgi:hypothetical protein